jgi:hypothetical protein
VGDLLTTAPTKSKDQLTLFVGQMSGHVILDEWSRNRVTNQVLRSPLEAATAKPNTNFRDVQELVGD